MNDQVYLLWFVQERDDCDDCELQFKTAHYRNLGSVSLKVKATVRISPAMAAGITDRLWDVADLVAFWEA